MPLFWVVGGGGKTMGAQVNRKHSSRPLDPLLVMCIQRQAEKTRMALFLHVSRLPRVRHSLQHHYWRHGIPLQKHFAVFRITTAGTTCRSIQALSTLPFGGLFGSLLSSSAQFGKTLRAEWTYGMNVTHYSQWVPFVNRSTVPFLCSENGTEERKSHWVWT